MLSSIKQRLDREDEGFTLIELMVVVLIIAILLAIAIPTFLGARNTANSRAAQSTLRNALTAEQTYFTNNNQAFGSTGTTPAISTIEPNITWLTATPSANNPNGVWAVIGNSTSLVFLQVQGNDGKCYTVVQNDSSGATGNTTGYNVAASCATFSSSSAAPTINAGSAAGNAGSAFYTTW